MNVYTVDGSHHMKNFWLNLSLACLPLLGMSQGSYGLVWSPAVPVANGAVYDNIRPQVTLAQDSVPLVIWCRSIGGRHGYVAHWNGAGFGTPVKVNPTGSINAYTVEGPNIVARGDTAYLVYVSSPATSAQVMLRSSFDGGHTWNSPAWVDSLGADLPTFGNVEILPGGQPIVTYIRQTSAYANPRWMVRKSMDAGLTWLPETSPSMAAPGGQVCDCCTGHTYSHHGKVVQVFRNNDSNLRDFWAAISTDGAATFPTAIDLDSTDWTLAACPSSGSSSLLVGDTIYTVFMSQGSNGLARVWLGASHLATGALAYNQMLNGGVAPNVIQNYPAMAGNGDTLLVAWMESSGGNPEVLLRYSFHGLPGLWANPVVNITEMATGQQSFPDIAWANGKLHVVWQDDATNQVMYRTAVVGIPTGNLHPHTTQWKIHPNPTRGRTHLEKLPGSACTLSLLDAEGRLVFQTTVVEGMHQLQLDLGNLAGGMYFLSLTQGSSHLGTKKVVIVD